LIRETVKVVREMTVPALGAAVWTGTSHQRRQ
jgi:hypothetical protein